MNFPQILFKTAYDENNVGVLAKMKNCIPKKMKCGLSFQYLPESIHMVRRYEIVTEKCKAELLKKLKPQNGTIKAINV